MLDALKSAWEASKVKFVLVAVPVVLLLLTAAFFKAYRAYLISTAKKLLAETNKKNEGLAAEEEEAKAQANQSMKDAQEAEKKIEDIRKEDDAYWYKKEGK
jgi:predicted Holliday junction resolvase-like endonuclease